MTATSTAMPIGTEAAWRSISDFEPDAGYKYTPKKEGIFPSEQLDARGWILEGKIKGAPSLPL
jgi:hypothetical protein